MDDATIVERFRRLEEQVALLSAKAGVVWDDESMGMPPDVVQLARGGDRLKAVVRYREITGVGLVEAKQAVDRL